MRQLLVAAMAALFVTNISALSFADEMGKGKEHMKGEMNEEMKGENGKTRDMGEMKSDKRKMRGESGGIKREIAGQDRLRDSKPMA